MSKRLQVVMDDAEYEEIQEAAGARRLTTSAWVRQVLREARAASTGDGTSVSGHGDDAPGASVHSPDALLSGIDGDLVRAVMDRHGLETAADAVEYALRRAAEPAMGRDEVLGLRGIGWSGDLDDLR